MNVEDAKTIRVIRSPAMSGIASALHDCAKVGREVPAELQRLLDRLNSEERSAEETNDRV